MFSFILSQHLFYFTVFCCILFYIIIHEIIPLHKLVATNLSPTHFGQGKCVCQSVYRHVNIFIIKLVMTGF